MRLIDPILTEIAPLLSNRLLVATEAVVNVLTETKMLDKTYVPSPANQICHATI